MKSLNVAVVSLLSICLLAGCQTATVEPALDIRQLALDTLNLAESSPDNLPPAIQRFRSLTGKPRYGQGIEASTLLAIGVQLGVVDTDGIDATVLKRVTDSCGKTTLGHLVTANLDRCALVDHGFAWYMRAACHAQINDQPQVMREKLFQAMVLPLERCPATAAQFNAIHSDRIEAIPLNWLRLQTGIRIQEDI
ncbi:MAG: hypothetical protein ACFHX7_22050 [Pseudomonadota bacterium]